MGTGRDGAVWHYRPAGEACLPDERLSDEYRDDGFCYRGYGFGSHRYGRDRSAYHGEQEIVSDHHDDRFDPDRCADHYRGYSRHDEGNPFDPKEGNGHDAPGNHPPSGSAR